MLIPGQEALLINGLHLRQFRASTVPEILESDIQLVCNVTDHIVTHLVEVTIPAQHRFSEAEMRVVLALLEASPHPCADAMLSAALTDVSFPNAHEMLEATGDYREIAMQPVHLVLQGCRMKLAMFNLGIQPYEQAGYRLFRLER